MALRAAVLCKGILRPTMSHVMKGVVIWKKCDWIKRSIPGVLSFHHFDELADSTDGIENWTR